MARPRAAEASAPAASRSFSLARQLGAILVEQPVGLAALGQDGDPRLQLGDRPFQPAGGGVEGAFRARLSHHALALRS